VATHSIKILDIDTPRISRYSIKSVGIEKFVTKIAVDPSHIDDWSHDLGVTPGELFLTTKRWLFVEGEVDKIVIETLFDDLLSQRGVRVVPARGSKNISHLMQLDFIRGVGGNVAVLLDKNAPDVRGQDEDQLRNSIEKGFFKRDLEETRKSINHKVGPSAVLLGVKEHHHIDMMFFFEPACVRDVLQDSPPRANQANSRIFDSWDEAWASFEKALVDASFAPSGSKPRKRTVHDFKAYLDVTFGIRVTPWFAKKVTHAMKVRGIVPEDLFALIDEVTSPLFGSPLS